MHIPFCQGRSVYVGCSRNLLRAGGVHAPAARWALELGSRAATAARRCASYATGQGPKGPALLYYYVVHHKVRVGGKQKPTTRRGIREYGASLFPSVYSRLARLWSSGNEPYVWDRLPSVLVRAETGGELMWSRGASLSGGPRREIERSPHRHSAVP